MKIKYGSELVQVCNSRVLRGNNKSSYYKFQIRLTIKRYMCEQNYSNLNCEREMSLFRP